VNIADQSERELIQSILEIYSKDEQACRSIANHIALKLAIRRAIIRERRKEPKTRPCRTAPSALPVTVA
jgi:hypothetical protein